jgi:hypothetical protein
MSDDLEPIRDDTLDDVGRWQRFASAQRTDPGRSDRSNNELLLVAIGLSAAAALMLAATILRTFQFSGISLGERVVFVSVSGAWASAFLSLAAASLSRAGPEARARQLARWALWCSSMVSAAVLVSAVYTAGYAVLAHPSGANVGDLISNSEVGNWSARIGAVLLVGSTAVLAGLELFIARRRYEALALPSEPGEPPTP